jgi:chromosome segregation ATPase
MGINVDWDNQDPTTKKRFSEIWLEIQVAENKADRIRAQMSALNNELQTYLTEIEAKKAELKKLNIVYEEV